MLIGTKDLGTFIIILGRRRLNSYGYKFSSKTNMLAIKIRIFILNNDYNFALKIIEKVSRLKTI